MSALEVKLHWAILTLTSLEQRLNYNADKLDLMEARRTTLVLKSELGILLSQLKV